MALLNNQLNQKIEALPPEMQQQVVHFVEFLALKHDKHQLQGKVSAKPISTKSSASEDLSAYDLAEKRGLIGSMEDPADLSTNKAYFDK